MTEHAMTRPDDTEPSAEACKAAAAVLPITWGKQLVRDVALALDRFRAAGVREERERAERVAQTEPELPGEPPYDVLAMIRTDPTEVMRIVCRVTKREIARRIREGASP